MIMELAKYCTTKELVDLMVEIAEKSTALRLKVTAKATEGRKQNARIKTQNL